MTAAVHTWRLDDLAPTAEQAAGELVANAARHSRSRSLRVTISRLAPLRLRIAVVDKSRVLPEPGVPELLDEQGRGLLILTHLCARWGCDLVPWGKKVWAEIDGRQLRLEEQEVHSA